MTSSAFCWFWVHKHLEVWHSESWGVENYFSPFLLPLVIDTEMFGAELSQRQRRLFTWEPGHSVAACLKETNASLWKSKGAGSSFTCFCFRYNTSSNFGEDKDFYPSESIFDCNVKVLSSLLLSILAIFSESAGMCSTRGSNVSVMCNIIIWVFWRLRWNGWKLTIFNKWNTERPHTLIKIQHWRHSISKCGVRD